MHTIPVLCQSFGDVSPNVNSFYFCLFVFLLFLILVLREEFGLIAPVLAHCFSITSINVSICGKEWGPDEDIFSQAVPLRTRRGFHSSQNSLFNQTCLLRRRRCLHSSQNLDFRVKFVCTRRSSRDICLDTNNQCIRKHTCDCDTCWRGYSSKYDLIEHGSTGTSTLQYLLSTVQYSTVQYLLSTV